MKKLLEKIGWLMISVFPIMILVGLQAGCAMVAMIIAITVFVLMGTPAVFATVEAQQIVMDSLLLPIVMISQVLTAIIAGCWYYFVWGRGRKDHWRRRASGLQLLLIPVLGVIVQFMTSGLLTVVNVLAPSLMESYLELIESSGLGEISVMMLLSTVILAPLCEELVCRGVILRLAQNISTRFWVINIVQAAAFGIMHGNLVQGTYAFFLGLILGYIYKRFGNIWICMLLHGAMNLSSVLVEPVFSLLPENHGILPMIPVILVSTVLFLSVMYILAKPIKAEVEPS